jgi:hypothetical protein
MVEHTIDKIWMILSEDEKNVINNMGELNHPNNFLDFLGNVE